MLNHRKAYSHEKVLIIDSEIWRLVFLRDLLTDLGYQVATAHNVAEGCAMIRDGDFDLVLTDLTMDSLGGFDVIRVSAESFSRPVVIVMTGQNLTQYGVRALRQGAFDVLVKPLDSERLNLAFERALDYRRLQAEVIRLSNDASRVLHVESPPSSLIFYDSVTGLPNRSLFFDRLNQTLLRKSEQEHCVALLIVAVEAFRRISLTHSAGEADAVLTIVARNLRNTVYTRDTVARIGDNQIAVIAEMSSSDRITKLLEKIEALSDTVVTENSHTHSVRLGIGVAFYPDDASAPEELYHHAFSALDAQESIGGGGHQFYRPDRDYHIRNRVQIERKLDKALTEQEYFVEYQPYHRQANGSVHGAEALLRWRGKDGVTVSPSEFIPVLEANRKIVPVTEWIIGELASLQEELISAGIRDQYLSFNVSPVQFDRHDDAMGLLDQIVEKCPDPSHIVVELTESVFLRDNHLTSRVIDRMVENRVAIAFDDFGTGYSSLSYLTRYHSDYLKIDRSFISGVDKRTGAATISAAIISMAHQLGIVVIAEGVETVGELGVLRKFSCDLVQGFLFSRPLRKDLFMEYLQNTTPGADKTSKMGKTTSVDERS